MPNTSQPDATWPALLIKGGAIERIALRREGSGSHHTHELIGHFFESCFTVPGAGARRQLVGYCDGEGLLRPRSEAPWNVFLDPQTLYRGGWPIPGPIVVCAHEAPDTVAMSELELSSFHVLPPAQAYRFEGEVIRLPLLVFRPGYEVRRA